MKHHRTERETTRKQELGEIEFILRRSSDSSGPLEHEHVMSVVRIKVIANAAELRPCSIC